MQIKFKARTGARNERTRREPIQKVGMKTGTGMEQRTYLERYKGGNKQGTNMSTREMVQGREKGTGNVGDCEGNEDREWWRL